MAGRTGVPRAKHSEAGGVSLTFGIFEIRH
jgi:hypothetical protein